MLLCPPRGPPRPYLCAGSAHGDPAVLPIPAPTGNARPAVWLPRVAALLFLAASEELLSGY